MLVIKNISKKFGNKKVLDNISLSVQKGTIAVLLGPSGVGKSTLLRMLNNLETVQSGTVELDNKSLDTTTVNQKHTVGMIFQQFNLFDHLTVEQNIMLALEKTAKKTKQQARDIAHHLLKRYGLEDKATDYPKQLSGGQKQRLGIARTVALKPKIICMDEPTSALDPLLTTHVAHAINELADEGYIVLVASHDTMLVEKLNCTIYLMEKGTIIETAQSDAFRKNKNAYPLIEAFVSGTVNK